MILQKIFLKLKSSQIADSRFMHTSVMQHVIISSLKVFNVVAPKLPICRRVKKGSLGEGCRIHPTALIDRDHVIIGNDCTIGEYVVIERNTLIGDHVTISAEAVIGSEGFELRRVAGEIVPVAHIGGVIIGDNAVIGCRACIDKSVLSEFTEVGASSVIGDGVEVGHGIKIGKDVEVAEGTMIGGYSHIGDRVRIGKRCSIADGLTLGDDVTIPDYAVVTRDVKKES
jgi:UDP-3-O-[3-hydroxymyristoyl] glucosamine N-acyltransferase